MRALRQQQASPSLPIDWPLSMTRMHVAPIEGWPGARTPHATGDDFALPKEHALRVPARRVAGGVRPLPGRVGVRAGWMKIDGRREHSALLAPASRSTTPAACMVPIGAAGGAGKEEIPRGAGERPASEWIGSARLGQT